MKQKVLHTIISDNKKNLLLLIINTNSTIPNFPLLYQKLLLVNCVVVKSE